MPTMKQGPRGPAGSVDSATLSALQAADATAAAHIADTNNPHNVTASQAGAQPVSSVLTSLASASYGSGRVLLGAGSGSPGTDANLTWDASNKWLVTNTFTVGTFVASVNYFIIGNSALDQTATGNYALGQDTLGRTIVNSATGQPVHLRINNSDMIQITPTSVAMTPGTLTVGSTANFNSGTSTLSGGLSIGSDFTAQGNVTAFPWSSTGTFHIGTTAGASGFWLSQTSPDASNYSFLGSNGADGGFPGAPVIYFNAPGSNGVCHFRQDNYNVALIRNGIWTFTNSYSAPYLSSTQVSVVSMAANYTPIGIQAASGQTSPLTSWCNSVGSPIAWIRPDGSWKPPALDDSSATNDSVYYSSTLGGLVYKDPNGTVRPLDRQWIG